MRNLKIIWLVLQRIWDKIISHFRHQKILESKPDLADVQPAQKEQVSNPISIRLPNMPKYQPCFNGHGWKRRLRKSFGGATYHCNYCGDFFVRIY